MFYLAFEFPSTQWISSAHTGLHSETELQLLYRRYFTWQPNSHPCSEHSSAHPGQHSEGITAVKHHTWNIRHGSWIPIHLVNIFYMAAESPFTIHAVNVHMYTLVYTLNRSHHTGNILHGSWFFIYSVHIMTHCFPSSLSLCHFFDLRCYKHLAEHNLYYALYNLIQDVT